MMKYSCSSEIKKLLESINFNSSIHFVEINDDNVRELDNSITNYVFIIEDGKHVFELLSYRPLGFIRKQHFDEDVENIRKIKPVNSTLLTFNNSGNKLVVSSDKILYLEAQSHYVIINTSTVVFKVRERISELVKRLEPYGFQQVHRSYVVNEQHVVAYKHDEVVLSKNIRIPVSKKYKQ